MKHASRYLHRTVLLAWLLIAHEALAIQSLEAVRGTAEDFVRAQLATQGADYHIDAASLDPRLRLHACTVPLQAFTQNAAAGRGARTTVGVRCSAANAWTVYVPVTVEIELPVLVLRRPLVRHARIGPDDVEPRKRRLPGSAAGFVGAPDTLEGYRLKRALPAGTALRLDMLVPDILVRRGQQVTLIAASGGVEIRARGQALSDASAAERVRVQNMASRKIVEGVVESDSIVRVGSPAQR
jgi:flagella basal body P-ring formation protein FlgA